ncbi:hypothetical protein MUK42_32707 [Musa troglodytarum]|uniref:Uncharacterized protein n=1 Tax=Musa troglodytarum TaxID=320322 RepID=A0A9E7KQ12_9LILI|nr:hypothetical protein MUK42_32707 [Musa troglodytarum]
MAILGKKASDAIASSASRQPSSLWQSVIRVGAARLGWPHSFLDPKDSPVTEVENEKQPTAGGDRLLLSNKTDRTPTKPDPSEGSGGKIN